jgi:hypothetical protein
VTSRSPAARLDWNVSWVPQRGQKLRVPWSEEANRTGSPAVKANEAVGTVNQATNGAPVVRRQIEQWQLVSESGVPWIR